MQEVVDADARQECRHVGAILVFLTGAFHAPFHM
jgi:hypothetical protein